jgi:hypothetical protein
MSAVAISGRVERLRFQKGYFVIADLAVSQDKTVTVKGQMPGVYEGDIVRILARKQNDPRWGEQWLIESCEHDERDGVAVVLELLPDVGPSRAAQIKEIVAQSGEDIFAVIERQPERLKAVKGLTAARIAAIREALMQRKAERDLLVWCGANGVSNYHAGIIWKKFGARSLAVLKETPYEVVRGDGIGFLTADRIARRAGADANGVDRAKAAILYVLAEAEAADGSTVVEAGMVMAACRGAERGPGGRRTACQLSPPLPDDVVYEALGLLKDERDIYMGGGDPPLVQRGITRGVEKALAERIVAFAQRPATAAPARPRWLGPDPEADDALETPWSF